MSTSTPPHHAGVVPRLAWSVRHYRRVLAALAVVIVGVTGYAAYRVAAEPPTYTATATVLGSKLVHDPSRLARLAATLAASDTVLDDAIARGELPYSSVALSEDHSEVRPLEDNVLVLVDGIDTDADRAIRTANALAEALTAELNRAGTGVGEFRVLTPAISGHTTDVTGTVLLLVAGGVVALLAAGLATIGLLNGLRRPVTRPAEAAAATGARVLAVIDGKADQAEKGGLLTLRAEAARSGADRILVLAPPRAERLAVAIAGSLRESASDGTFYPAPGSQGSLAVPGGTSVLVVVPEGLPVELLHRTVERVPAARIAGIAFVRNPRRR